MYVLLVQPDAYFGGEILSLNYSLVSLHITQKEQKLFKNVPLRSEHPGLPRWKKVTLSVPLFMASHPIALVWWSRGQEEGSLEDDIFNQKKTTLSTLSTRTTTGLIPKVSSTLIFVKIIIDDF